MKREVKFRPRAIIVILFILSALSSAENTEAQVSERSNFSYYLIKGDKISVSLKREGLVNRGSVYELAGNPPGVEITQSTMKFDISPPPADIPTNCSSLFGDQGNLLHTLRFCGQNNNILLIETVKGSYRDEGKTYKQIHQKDPSFSFVDVRSFENKSLMLTLSRNGAEGEVRFEIYNLGEETQISDPIYSYSVPYMQQVAQGMNKLGNPKLDMICKYKPVNFCMAYVYDRYGPHSMLYPISIQTEQATPFEPKAPIEFKDFAVASPQWKIKYEIHQITKISHIKGSAMLFIKDESQNMPFSVQGTLTNTGHLQYCLAFQIDTHPGPRVHSPEDQANRQYVGPDVVHFDNYEGIESYALMFDTEQQSGGPNDFRVLKRLESPTRVAVKWYTYRNYSSIPNTCGFDMASHYIKKFQMVNPFGRMAIFADKKTGKVVGMQVVKIQVDCVGETVAECYLDENIADAFYNSENKELLVLMGDGKSRVIVQGPAAISIDTTKIPADTSKMQFSVIERYIGNTGPDFQDKYDVILADINDFRTKIEVPNNWLVFGDYYKQTVSKFDYFSARTLEGNYLRPSLTSPNVQFIDKSNTVGTIKEAESTSFVRYLGSDAYAFVSEGSDQLRIEKCRRNPRKMECKEIKVIKIKGMELASLEVIKQGNFYIIVGNMQDLSQGVVTIFFNEKDPLKTMKQKRFQDSKMQGSLLVRKGTSGSTFYYLDIDGRVVSFQAQSSKDPDNKIDFQISGPRYYTLFYNESFSQKVCAKRIEFIESAYKMISVYSECPGSDPEIVQYTMNTSPSYMLQHTKMVFENKLALHCPRKDMDEANFVILGDLSDILIYRKENSIELIDGVFQSGFKMFQDIKLHRAKCLPQHKGVQIVYEDAKGKFKIAHIVDSSIGRVTHTSKILNVIDIGVNVDTQNYHNYIEFGKLYTVVGSRDGEGEVKVFMTDLEQNQRYILPRETQPMGAVNLTVMKLGNDVSPSNIIQYAVRLRVDRDPVVKTEVSQVKSFSIGKGAILEDFYRINGPHYGVAAEGAGKDRLTIEDRLSPVQSTAKFGGSVDFVDSFQKYTITVETGGSLHIHQDYEKNSQQTLKLQEYTSRAIIPKKFEEKNLNVVVSMNSYQDGTEFTVYWFPNNTDIFQDPAAIKSSSFKVKEYYTSLFGYLKPPVNSKSDLVVGFISENDISQTSFQLSLSEKDSFDHGLLSYKNSLNATAGKINSVISTRTDAWMQAPDGTVFSEEKHAELVDYKGPQFTVGPVDASNVLMIKKLWEKDAPYDIHINKYFAFSTEYNIGLTPSRILLIPQKHVPKGDGVSQFSLLYPGYDHLWMAVSPDNQYIASIAVQNTRGNEDQPMTKVIIYKRGSTHAHSVMDVVIEDMGKIAEHYSGLIAVTEDNMLVLSGLLRTEFGTQIFKINSGIRVGIVDGQTGTDLGDVSFRFRGDVRARDTVAKIEKGILQNGQIGADINAKQETVRLF